MDNRLFIPVIKHDKIKGSKMKMTLFLMLWLSSNLFSKESVENIMEREIMTCLASQNKAIDTYDKLQDKNLKSKREIETIKMYQRALLSVEADCKKIHAFRKDAEQAGRLALEIDATIKALE